MITGATRMECQTIDDVFSCLETGLALRHTGPMMLNQLSSRSHSIFTLYIQQAWTQGMKMFQLSQNYILFSIFSPQMDVCLKSDLSFILWTLLARRD